MANFNKNHSLIASVLVFAFLASYINFSTYKPKVIRQVEDVKGLQTQNTNDMPLPTEAEKISVSKSSGGELTTFYTNKTKKEVQDFYKNILASTKWEVESQGSYDDFAISRYSKDKTNITVVSYDSNNEFRTFVSLEKSTL